VIVLTFEWQFHSVILTSIVLWCFTPSFT
jgi:hypothetical protein